MEEESSNPKILEISKSDWNSNQAIIGGSNDFNGTIKRSRDKQGRSKKNIKHMNVGVKLYKINLLEQEFLKCWEMSRQGRRINGAVYLPIDNITKESTLFPILNNHFE